MALIVTMLALWSPLAPWFVGLRGPLAWFALFGLNWTVSGGRVALCLCTINRFTGIIWPLQQIKV